MNKFKLFILISFFYIYGEPQSDLLHAAQNGDKASIEKALENGSDPNKRDDKRGFTALMWACITSSIEAVQLILKNNANPNTQDNHGYTPLMLAAERGKVQIVAFLLENGAQINEKNNYGETALMLAAENGENETVALLLEKGAAPNEEGRNRFTALTLAVKNGYIETVKLLLENGAKCDMQDRQGTTPLIRAAEKGFSDIVRYLLEKGADFEKQVESGDFAGWTSLMWAAANRHDEVVKILLVKGVDPNKKSISGKTALILAVDNNDSAIVRFLINAGALIPELLIDNPLLKEALENKHKIAKEFFNFIKARGTTQKSILDKIRKLMKEEACRITTLKDSKGENVLHIVAAYFSPRSRVARFFLYYFPALLTKKNNDGRTPFQLAMMADPAKRKLFWKAVEQMPSALRKKVWELLSDEEKQKVVKLREFIGKSNESRTSSKQQRRKVESKRGLD